MNKEERKELNKKLQQEQLELEREFHKTTFGKIMKVIAIITVTVMALGLILAFSYHVFDLEQVVQDFADKCIKYSGETALFISILYGIILPTLKNNKDKKTYKEILQKTIKVVINVGLLFLGLIMIFGIILNDYEMIIYLTLPCSILFLIVLFIAVILEMIVNKNLKGEDKEK